MFTITRRTMRVGATVLALAAGTTWSTVLLAEPAASSEKSDAASRGKDKEYLVCGDFYTSKDLRSMKVVNANNESVGEIEDFIFDRGNGRIEYALIKSGAVLGIGGKTIAVQYGDLGYDPAESRFLLNMTREQIERSAKFVPENWRELERTTWEDELDATLYAVEKAVTGKAAELDTKQWVDAPKEHIKGTITSVQRQDSLFGPEQIVVVVRTEDGVTREVSLGPAWYVMGHDPAPMRGDTVNITARMIERDNTSTWYGTEMTIDGKELTLRDKDFNPSWRLPRDSDRAENGSARGYEPGVGRLMLISDFVGAPARALDEDGGEVQEAIVERQSGRIAMIGFDPNDKVLGLGDKIRCVPWAVLSVRGDETVSIDATKEMLQVCEPMPERVGDFASPARLEPVYRAFDIDVYCFRPGAVTAKAPVDTTAVADHRCAWIEAAKSGKDVSISGEVVNTRTEAISTGEPEAYIVTIESIGARKSVVLGPAWYVKRQNLDLDADDTLTVTGRAITLNGQEYIVARVVTSDGEAIKLWNGDQPAWASR